MISGVFCFYTTLKDRIGNRLFLAFQSLFYWMLGGKPVPKIEGLIQKCVSILILLDVGGEGSNFTLSPM
ncbi:MAG: hypothetical protein C0397_15070 [Odoribacter sp.]|nr:hypothetical protein [Odoribacter sp.]